ncbi:MAG: tRNA (adenosine(37)-N6)-threonylcarbamoyltransferase complex transferase subunit TsaD [Clostridia bacterium]|nr:tRNA (adenosine(37)-N6)-threonylcarbamoyltransferase complex transferase subunit TsaD [Clostridia bacterium]
MQPQSQTTATNPAQTSPSPSPSSLLPPTSYPLSPSLKIFAIESSCDDTAAAVVENGRKVLSSVVASQVFRHVEFGGVVPEIAGRMHCEAISGVAKEAFSQAGVTIDDVDAIAVTAYPGLIGSLLVGVNFAKGLALTASKPLIPVHHLRGHIAANFISHPGLEPPFLCLVVSGGHSHIVEVKDFTDMRIIGRTRDDAAGEAFDKTARTMGLPYPGGVHMDKLAENGNPEAFTFPVPKVSGSPYDFSFSGLKTAVINTIHNMQQKGMELPREDMAASVRNSVVNILTDRFLLAARDTGYKRLVLAGGVSANSLLRRRMKELCDAGGYELYYPALSLCGDNAAMIGAQGYFEFLCGHTADMSLNARAERSIEL